MAGRPTDYRPEYCEQVIAWGKEGKSLIWMASRLGVHKDTVYEWIKVHPEFSDSMTQARQFAQAWWEDIGQSGVIMHKEDGIFNASVWSRSMAARFPEDWREKSETALTGANGSPLVVESIVRRVVDAK